MPFADGAATCGDNGHGPNSTSSPHSRGGSSPFSDRKKIINGVNKLWCAGEDSAQERTRSGARRYCNHRSILCEENDRTLIHILALNLDVVRVPNGHANGDIARHQLGHQAMARTLTTAWPRFVRVIGGKRVGLRLLDSIGRGKRFGNDFALQTLRQFF